MPTAIETTTAIQDKVFESLEVSQRAVVEAVRSWSRTVESMFSKLPDLASAEPMKPSQVLENGVGFTERLLTTNREFANRLFEAALPATHAPSAGAAAASAQATKPKP